MRHIVTGAAGFLGSHLTDRLLAEGHEVMGIDNLITGRRENLSHLEREFRFDFVEADVSEPWPTDGLGPAGKVDGIFHLASPASPVDYLRHPIATLKAGSLGTLNALEAARRRGARLLLASTSEVYGDPLVHPQPETYWGNVNPVGPRAVYDEAKRFAEALTTAYRREQDVDTRIARIFNTYGPRMRPDDGRVVSNFIVQALRGEPLTVYGDGSQSRSFCYVSDLVEGLWRLFRGTEPGPMNLGNPGEYTIRQLRDLVVAAAGAPGEDAGPEGAGAETMRAANGSDGGVELRPLPVDDPKVRCPDISLAKSALEWEPKIPLREGLALTVAHFRRRMMEGTAHDGEQSVTESGRMTEGGV